MTLPGSASPKLRFVAAAAAFTALYFAAAELTSSLVGGSGIAVLWPASGVYLGVMLVAPRQLWPALALGAGLGSLAAYSHAGSSLELSVAFAVPSSAEGLLGAVLVERIARGRFRLDGLRDLSALVVGGAATATAVVALSAGAVAAQTFNSSFGESWLRWWSADALGVLAVAPLIVAWARSSDRRPSGAELRYTVLVVVVVAFAVWSEPSSAVALVGGALALPILLWAGSSWGIRAAALGGAGVAIAAMHLASQGSDVLADAARVGGQVHIVQAFLAALILSSLAFAAAVADARRERSEATRSRRWLRQVMDSSPDAYLTVDADGKITGWSQSAEAMFGLDGEQATGRSLETLAPGAGPVTPTPEARELTLLARHRTGREFPAALTVRAGSQADDGLWHVFVRDLTESERLGKQLDRANAELERRGLARDEARSELRGTSQELERAGRKIDRLTAELDTRTSELTDTRRDLTARDRELVASKRELEARRREHAAAAIGRDQARAELERSAREAGRLQADLARTTGDLTRLRTELTNTAGELTRTKAEARALESELESARAGDARAAHELDRLRVEHATAADELDRVRAHRAAAADELDRLRVEQERLAAELAAAVAGRRSAEHALDETSAAVADAEAERRLLGEHSGELISRYDDRGICLYASPGSRRLLGYEPEELVGCPGAQLLHPEDRARLLRARASGAASTFEARLRRSDGSYVSVEVAFQPASIRAGGRIGVVTTVVRELAAARAQDDGRRVAETRFHSLFGTLPTGSALLGRDGRIRRANLALSRLTGYSREQLEGTALATLVDDDSASLFAGRLRQVASGQVATLRLDQRLAHAGGRTVPVELTITPIPAADGPDANGGARLHELVVHFQDAGGRAGSHEAPRRFATGQSQTAA